MITKIYQFYQFLQQKVNRKSRRNVIAKGSFLSGLTQMLLLFGDVDVNTLKTMQQAEAMAEPQALSPPAVVRTPTVAVSPVSRPPKTMSHLRTLFSHLKSPAVIAICAAEGNCQVNGTYTAKIQGHSDPATGQLNRGFCSNHGRGGTLTQANQWCLQRLRQQLIQMEQTFLDIGILPEQQLEGLINAVDLWNQSPKRGKRFPSLYATALHKGLSGIDAILWARVETFRDAGGYHQNNLARFPICSRHESAQFCVTRDQKRRVRAISSVLQLQPVQ